jgi:hypothetical protein
MSKYKNINSSSIHYVLTKTLDVSSIGTNTHLLVLLTYSSIIRLYCLQPIVLGIILMNITQGTPFAPKIIHNFKVLFGKAQSCRY